MALLKKVTEGQIACRVAYATLLCRSQDALQEFQEEMEVCVMITHKARFNTKAYTAALRQAADLLEEIDTMNSYVSGNGTDTVLECQARIATSEPENPLYDGAVHRMYQYQRLFAIPTKTCRMYQGTFCQSEII